MTHAFKDHTLSDAQKLWVTEVGRTEKVDPKVLKVKLYNQLPQDFEPESIDPRIYANGRLTPIGLRLVNPDHEIFAHMHQILVEIRNRIISNPGVVKFDADDIAKALGLGFYPTSHAMREFGYLGNFHQQAIGTGDGLGFSSITLSGDDAYDDYLRYTTIDDLLERRYQSYVKSQGTGMNDLLAALSGNGNGKKVSQESHPERFLASTKINTAFVIMAIDPNDPSLEDNCNAIKEACACFGIRAYRADEIEHQDRITDTILEEIRTCEYLIADLTLERPNVYYEIGYAHAIRKKPILFRKAGTRIHFDLSVHNVPSYKNATELKDLLKRRLSAMLGREPSK